MQNLESQIREIVSARPMIDIKTSILLTIKSNLISMIEDPEHFKEIEPLTLSILKHEWAKEIRDIELEIIMRN